MTLLRGKQLTVEMFNSREPRGKIPVPGWAEMHENHIKYTMKRKEKKKNVIVLCTQQNFLMHIIFM